jgi:2-phospho-L-lactate transferase/gluconeogenesis factor (CofD/UPF0052 family)
MKDFNVVIFSGGTGSTQIQKGIRQIFDYDNFLYKKMKIINIINAYDDGKSTGVVRNVCNVLGPSDIRKIQYERYCQQNGEDIDENIRKFYKERLTLKGNLYEKKEQVIDFLNKLQLSQFNKYVSSFFERSSFCQYRLKTLDDFNIANIIYAEMFSQKGYTYTINAFNKFLNLNDEFTVVLCSYDNMKLCAITKSNGYIYGESSIVNYCNLYDHTDEIKDIFYLPYLHDSELVNFPKRRSNVTPSNESIEAVNNSDIIIFSCGTQWSSLIPTYKCLSHYINESNAKKFLIMNNDEDYDCKGVSASEILNHVGKYINLDNFNILINTDTINHLLNQKIDYHKKVYYENLGYNDFGEHDPDKTVRTIFKIYFDNIFNRKIYDYNICVDFDDTIVSRKYNITYDDYISSKSNLDTLLQISKHKDVNIISGHSIEHIYDIAKKLNVNIKNSNINIYANGGVDYDHDVIYELYKIDIDYYIKNMIVDFGIDPCKISVRGKKSNPLIISVKPLSNQERIDLVSFLNLHLAELELTKNFIAKKTGSTTVDIMHKELNKAVLIDHGIIDVNSSIYIGDEFDSGNDKEISQRLPSYHVKDTFETNIILKTILRNIND